MPRLSIEKKLEKAIKDGDVELAANLAKELAGKSTKVKKKDLKPKVSIKPEVPKSTITTTVKKTESQNVQGNLPCKRTPFYRTGPTQFLDDGSHQSDTKIDKLIDRSSKTSRREPVKNITCICSLTGKKEEWPETSAQAQSYLRSPDMWVSPSSHKELRKKYGTG